MQTQLQVVQTQLQALPIQLQTLQDCLIVGGQRAVPPEQATSQLITMVEAVPTAGDARTPAVSFSGVSGRRYSCHNFDRQTPD